MNQKIISDINKNASSFIEKGEFPFEAWRSCGTERIHGLFFTKEKEKPIKEVAEYIKELAYHTENSGFLFALCAQLFACSYPLSKYANNFLRDTYFNDISNGKLILCNGMTEERSGSNTYSMNSKAERTSGGYILTGKKIYCSNAPIANLAVVYTVTDIKKGFYGGITAFLLDKTKGHFSTTEAQKKVSLPSCQMGEIQFDNVFVEDKYLIGKEGAGASIFSESMNVERIGMSALHLGKMKQLLEECVTFAKKRKVGDEKIINFQAVAHRLANMKISYEASNALYKQLITENSPHKKTAQIAVLKTFISEAFEKMANDGVKLFGGQGVQNNTKVAQAYKDSIAGTIYSGTNDIMRNIITKWL